MALGERRHEERERSRSEQRASQSLQRAEADERARRPGEAAEQRARGKKSEARNEHPAPAEQVGQAAAEQQRPTEEDGVRGDHPLQPRVREAEIGLDRGERDIHNRDVENDHELSGDDESECAPAPPGRNRMKRGKQADPPIVGMTNYTREERLVALHYSTRWGLR